MVVRETESMINVYQINWVIYGGGCRKGGGCVDKYGTDIIPAKSQKQAREMIKQARPSANISKIVMLANLLEKKHNG